MIVPMIHRHLECVMPNLSDSKLMLRFRLAALGERGPFGAAGIEMVV